MAHATSHFSPWQPQRPCWHCVRFDGLGPDGSVAYCALARAARVRSRPADGCSAFEREVGADDEPGPPVPLHRLNACPGRAAAAT